MIIKDGQKEKEVLRNIKAKCAFQKKILKLKKYQNEMRFYINFCSQVPLFWTYVFIFNSGWISLNGTSSGYTIHVSCKTINVLYSHESPI